MSNAAILLGGGNSTRMGDTIEDKITTSIVNKPVFAYSFEAFIESGVVDTLVIVCKNSIQQEFIERWMSNNLKHDLNIQWCQGGDKRQDSVLSGLKILPNATQYVFIHDLARPMIQSSMIRELYKVLLLKQAATLAHPIVDTIKQVITGTPQKINNLDRSTLWAMETPQAFLHSTALEAVMNANTQGLVVTDETEAVNMLGVPIEIVENPKPNPKITFSSDLDYVTFLLNHQNNYVLH